MRSHHQSGFTLIELVLAVVILGILAALALPRFANLKNQAQLSSSQSLAGALRSAVNIAHAAWIVQGASGTQVTLEGVSFSVNSLGWPDAGMGTTGVERWGCKAVIVDANGVGYFMMNTPPLFGNCLNCYQAGGSGSLCTYTLMDEVGATTHVVRYNVATGEVTST